MFVDLQDSTGIISRLKPEEGFEEKVLPALKVPMSTVVSIICELKKFGTTSHTCKLGDQGRKTIVRVVTENQTVTLSELQGSSVEGGEPLRKKTNQAGMVMVRRKRHRAARCEASCSE